MFIGSLLSPEPTWFDYYRGGIVGFFISGVILQIMNKWQRKKEEMKEDKGLIEKSEELEESVKIEGVKEKEERKPKPTKKKTYKSGS